MSRSGNVLTSLAAAIVLLAATLAPVCAAPSPRTTGRNPAPGIGAPASLLSVPLPVGTFSPGAELRANLSLWLIPPGTRSNRSGACCPGFAIEYVVAGEYRVRASEPFQILRGGTVAERVAAGVEVMLVPGDALTIRNETALEAANVGSSPVRLVTWLAIEVDPDGPEIAGRGLRGWARASVGRTLAPMLTPPTDAVARLYWAEIPPGESLDLPEATAGFATSPTKDDAGNVIYSRIARPGEGRFVNIGRMTVPVYVLALGPASGEACRWETETPACSALS